MLQQENLADKELVVGSIRVLGNVTGGGTEKVKQNLEMLQNTVKTQTAKQEDYWSSLTKDGVISAVEKKQLKKEYEGIDSTHTALMAQAEAKGVDMSSEVVAYDTAYEDLTTYLFTTLQLFNKMSENTVIESAEVFNGYYNTYYKTLQNAQSRVNIGESGKIRVISSLTELGTDGEVVLFENNFYMYDLENHEWIGISVASKVGEYTGVRTSSPPQVLNQYFLVGNEGIVEDFIQVVTELRTEEDSALTDESGNIIYINYGFQPGYIYYWSENNEFVQVTDKNNWRYIIAMNDMIACGYEISPELYEWLTGELAENIGQEVEENVFAHTPKYKRVQSLPQYPNDGDYILWDASSTSRFTKGHLYVYQKATVEWIELNPQDTSGEVRSKFMTALTDILEVNPTETGYFSTVFAGAFFGNTATINSLNAATIELEESGYIKSKGYIADRKGFILNGDGTAKFTNISITNGYAKQEDLDAADERIAAAEADIEQAQADITQAEADIEQAQADIVTAQNGINAAQQDLDNVKLNYIAQVDVEYALSTSETSAPTEGWSTTAPEYTPGWYMWQRTKTTKGTTASYSDPTCISGAKGNSVSKFREMYYSSTSKTGQTGGNWVYDQPELEAGRYLWTKTEMTWEDQTITYTDPILATAIEQVYSDVKDAEKAISDAEQEIKSAKGDIATAQGDINAAQQDIDTVKTNYIAQVDVEYALSTSETVAPTEGWSTTAPEYTPGYFMWQRTKIVKNGTASYSNPTCITGAKGNSVSKFREMYYSSTSNTEQTGGTWMYDQPELEKDHYLWTKTEMTWEDNTVTYTDPILAAAIEQVYSDVKDAEEKLEEQQQSLTAATDRLNTAEGNLATATETLGAVTEKREEEVFIKGQIIQEAGSNEWAFCTEGFDPDDENCAGFGVRKNGNVYANNGIFRGTVYASAGEFQGNVLIGTQTTDSDGYINGTKIIDGEIKSKHASVKSFMVKNALSIDDTSAIKTYRKFLFKTRSFFPSGSGQIPLTYIYTYLDSMFLSPTNDNGINFATGHFSATCSVPNKTINLEGQIYYIRKEYGFIYIGFGCNSDDNYMPYSVAVKSDNTIVFQYGSTLYSVTVKGIWISVFHNAY